jgi:hypothetical protein
MATAMKVLTKEVITMMTEEILRILRLKMEKGEHAEGRSKDKDTEVVQPRKKPRLRVSLSKSTPASQSKMTQSEPGQSAKKKMVPKTGNGSSRRDR